MTKSLDADFNKRHQEQSFLFLLGVSAVNKRVSGPEGGWKISASLSEHPLSDSAVRICLLLGGDHKDMQTQHDTATNTNTDWYLCTQCAHTHTTTRNHHTHTHTPSYIHRFMISHVNFKTDLQTPICKQFSCQGGSFW